MKPLITLLLTLGALCSIGQKKDRYFMIGWVGWDSVKNVSIGGGYDTTMRKYPNLYKFKSFFKKKYNTIEVYIYGVTEYTFQERNEFWNIEKITE